MSPSRTSSGLKSIFIISIILNLFLASFFIFFIHSRGGVSYFKNKIHEIFSNKSIIKEEVQYTPPRKNHFYDLFTSFSEKLPSSDKDIIFIGDSHIEYGPWSELFQTQT